MKKSIILVVVIGICFLVYKILLTNDRYYFYSTDKKYCITYLIDNQYVYILPYKYLSKQLPTNNFLKFNRKNYSEEMNILNFFFDKKYGLVIEYGSGDLIQNKLNAGSTYINSNLTYKNIYIYNIIYGKNLEKTHVNSAYIRDYTFFGRLNKIIND